MKKVYCKNCRGNGNLLLVIGGWEWCERRNPYTKAKIRATMKEELNKDGECPHYKKKCYKFWVK